MTDLFARLELIHEALTATADSLAAGRAPGDEAERDRCRRVAELLAGQGRRVVDLLAKPPADSLGAEVQRRYEQAIDAEFERARDRRRAEARVVAETDREQGEGP